MGLFKQWHTIRGVPVLQFTQSQKQRVSFAESQKENLAKNSDSEAGKSSVSSKQGSVKSKGSQKKKGKR